MWCMRRLPRSDDPASNVRLCRFPPHPSAHAPAIPGGRRLIHLPAPPGCRSFNGSAAPISAFGSNSATARNNLIAVWRSAGGSVGAASYAARDARGSPSSLRAGRASRPGRGPPCRTGPAAAAAGPRHPHLRPDRRARAGAGARRQPRARAGLVRRGLSDVGAARAFLEPREGHDPGAFAGIDRAVALIERHIRDRGRIVVHGDYDVDGVCATATMVRALRALGADVGWYLPDRLTDGYG